MGLALIGAAIFFINVGGDKQLVKTQKKELAAIERTIDIDKEQDEIRNNRPSDDALFDSLRKHDF